MNEISQHHFAANVKRALSCNRFHGVSHLDPALRPVFVQILGRVIPAECLREAKLRPCQNPVRVLR
jgi:hypothetical protein